MRSCTDRKKTDLKMGKKNLTPPAACCLLYIMSKPGEVYADKNIIC